MKKIRNILILAGGDSTRFWPFTRKSLFSFLGKPIVHHIIENVSPYAEQITVVIDKENRRLFENMLPSIHLVSQNAGKRTMGDAVYSCKGKIKGDVIILNAEDVFDYRALSQYTKLIQSKKPDYIFLTKKLDRYFSGGYLKFKGNIVEEIIEKPPPDRVPSHFIKLVADYFSDFDAFVDILKKVRTDQDDLYEQAMNIYLTRHPNGAVVENKGYWQALKYPWHALSMTRHFLGSISSTKIGRTMTISEKALITGPVLIGDNVVIGDFSKIVGPCFIGDETIVGDFAIVRESHIGNHSLIGGYSEVARSYLGSRVYLHNNYIGDSILGDDVLMGARGITANFRFDQQNIHSAFKDKKVDTQLVKCGAFIGPGAKIGVNATLYPGVKIGRDTWIAPGETVSKDVEDAMFIREGKKFRNTHL